MKLLSKIISYPLSAIFYIIFGFNLLLFDLIQRICLNLLGYTAHKLSVEIFNLIVIRSLHLVGTSFEIITKEEIPKGVPIIIASNHQSLWDIPPFIWFLRKYHPKFISKIELGEKIPTISYNLKYGGSVLIDRKDPLQATKQIEKIARYIEKHKRSVVIFPEGTRSRKGIPKPFKRKGLEVLFKHAPNAHVLPISISNSWKLQRFGMFPIPVGVRLKFIVHPSLKVKNFESQNLIDEIEETIKSAVDRQ